LVKKFILFILLIFSFENGEMKLLENSEDIENCWFDYFLAAKLVGFSVNEFYSTRRVQ
jgi:hypothetical protein